jgi:hypothetical protein
LALRDGDELAAGIRRRHYAASIAALALSTWIFVSVILPVRNERHLLPLLPALLLFAGVAIARIKGSGTNGWRTALAAVTAVIAIAPVVSGAARLPPKFDAGTAAVVRMIEADHDLDGGQILVSSELFGEGIFIATLAEHDHGNGHVVLRASKVLSSSTWSGSDYRLAFANADEMDAALRRLRVDAIVVDTRAAEGPHAAHHRQLLEMLSRYPTHWPAMPSPAASPRFTMFRASHDEGN